MARKKKSSLPSPISVPLPFKILIDNQEKLPYEFRGMTSNANFGNLPYDITSEVDYVVSAENRHLGYLGDYSLTHLNEENEAKYGRIPKCIIERKSKSDFFSSMADRANFEERVARLSEEAAYAAVVVESEWDEMFRDPPKYWKKGILVTSEMSPTVISRTVQSWTMEYSNVHWFTYPGREAAEGATFQLLMRFWEKFKKFETDQQRKTSNYKVYHEGQRAKFKKKSIEDNPYPRTKTYGDPYDWWMRGYIDMCDIMSEKTRGRTKCSEPPVFPTCIFNSDFRHED